MNKNFWAGVGFSAIVAFMSAFLACVDDRPVPWWLGVPAAAFIIAATVGAMLLLIEFGFNHRSEAQPGEQS